MGFHYKCKPNKYDVMAFIASLAICGLVFNYIDGVVKTKTKSYEFSSTLCLPKDAGEKVNETTYYVAGVVQGVCKVNKGTRPLKIDWNPTKNPTRDCVSTETQYDVVFTCKGKK